MNENHRSGFFRKQRRMKIQIVFHHHLIFILFIFSLNQQKPMVCLDLPCRNIEFSLSELIAGKLTRLLVGTRNTGPHNFIVESIDGSFRYPQDFTYHIQNFTTLRPEKVVEPGWEATFEYLFMPSETFNGRPMGLVVVLNYRNYVRRR